MVTVTREFAPADRYLYDFRVCVPSKGWAQFDTTQDAPYFGNWVNPSTLELFTYAEGDTVHVKCDDDADFVAEVRRKVQWHRENEDFKGIDTMCRDEITAAFVRLGLADCLHQGIVA